MEKTSRNVRYLNYQEIVEVNRRFILHTGGFTTGAGHLENPDSLHYLIEIVKAKFGDEEIYPSLAEKAALYVFNIITRHIFLDGNKRTGMVCALWFLRLNGCSIRELSDDEIIEFTLGIANGTIDMPDVVTWIKERVLE
jgi:death-on-curing protein